MALAESEISLLHRVSGIGILIGEMSAAGDRSNCTKAKHLIGCDAFNCYKKVELSVPYNWIEVH